MQLVRMCVLVHIDHQTNVNEVQTSDRKCETHTHSISHKSRHTQHTQKITNSIECALQQCKTALEISWKKNAHNFYSWRMDGETEKVANSKNFDIVFRGQVEIYRNPSIDFQLETKMTPKSRPHNATVQERDGKMSEKKTPWNRRTKQHKIIKYTCIFGWDLENVTRPERMVRDAFGFKCVCKAHKINSRTDYYFGVWLWWPKMSENCNNIVMSW